MSNEKKFSASCANRREFLLAGGVAAALATIGGMPANAYAVTKGYPRKKIGRVKHFKTGKPKIFNYPDNKIENIVIKLGEEAGGGVGPDGDIVAFNTICTHMGGDIGKTKYHGYKNVDKVMGPCPHHLSTFDLTRHGIIVSGHATESLPQIVLEVEDGNLYAVGIIGLLYGRNQNVEKGDGPVVDPDFGLQERTKPMPIQYGPSEGAGGVYKEVPGSSDGDSKASTSFFSNPKRTDDTPPEEQPQLVEESDSSDDESKDVFESSPLKDRRRDR